jgi:hypothetical protein
MRTDSAAAGVTHVLTCLFLLVSLLSCSPKYVVRGRVVDAETQQPIHDAAVAIRWFLDRAEQQPTEPETIDAVQGLTDAKGYFQIPQYPEQPYDYVLGVYKWGYICWSSRDVFSMTPDSPYRRRKHHQIKEGMQIALLPLKEGHHRELHAGFTMMVAGESTDTDSGPFHQAIQPEYQLWRENLRKDFQKKVGAK